MKNNLCLVAVIFTTMAFFSCKKENNSSITNELKGLASPSQKFSVDAVQGGEITGLQGTRLIFPPNTFYYNDGNNTVPIASGSVNIELIEIFKRGSMIMHSKPTIAGNHLLVSGGEFYVKASQGDRDLKYLNAKAFIPAQNTNPTPPMQLFVWDENNNWNTTIPDTNMAIITDPVTGTHYGTIFPGDYDWVNCDYFYNYTGPRKNISIKTEGADETASTIVYIVFTDFLAVAQTSQDDNNISQYQFIECPQNVNFKIVGLSISNGKWKAGMSEIKNADSMPAINTLALQSMTGDEVKNMLNAL